MASELGLNVDPKWFAILTLTIEEPRLSAQAIGDRVGLSQRRVYEIRAHPDFRALYARRARRLVDAVVVGTLEDGVDARKTLNQARRNGVTQPIAFRGDPELEITEDGIGPAAEDPDSPVDAGKVAVAEKQRDHAVRLATAVIKADAQGKRPTITEAPAKVSAGAKTLDDLLDEADAVDVKGEVMAQIERLEAGEEESQEK